MTVKPQETFLTPLVLTIGPTRRNLTRISARIGGLMAMIDLNTPLNRWLVKAALHRALNSIDNEISEQRVKFADARTETTRHQARCKIELLDERRKQFLTMFNALTEPGD